MTGIVSSLDQLVRRSLSGRLILFILAALVAFIVLVLGVTLVTGLIVGLAATVFQASEILFLGTTFIFILLAVLAFFYFSTVFEGFLYHFSRDHLDSQALSIERSWNQIKPRIKTVFIQRLIVSIISLLAVILITLPLVMSLISFIQTPEGVEMFSFMLYPPESELEIQLAQEAMSIGSTAFMEQNGTVLGITFIILAILAIIFVPFFLLYKTVPYFEKVGVIESLKLSWYRAKRHFVFNWVFFIIFLIGLIALSIIIESIAVIFTTITGMDSSIGLLLILFFAGSLIFQGYLSTISSLFSVIVYEQNAPVSHFPSTPHEEAPPLKLPKDPKPKRNSYRKTIKKTKSR